ncbi:hypothetical protein AZE42_09230 [Rhizopogon vesiculosus]
MPRIG